MEFMASNAAAIPPVVLRKSRRVRPFRTAVRSTNAMASDSTRAWSAVWLKGGNSSFDTFCVGTADRNVAPFLAEGTSGKGDGEDAIVSRVSSLITDTV